MADARHPMLDAARGDVVFALRSFRKTPGFALTIILTLGLTIGASTAMFSIVNGVLLNPLPLGNAGRLVWSVNHGSRHYDAMSPPDYRDWTQSIASFEATATWVVSKAALDGAAAPVQLSIADVTDNWFSMLGVRMEHGRGFAPGEQGIGKQKIAILSDGLWRRQFGADSTIVGRTVLLDGERYTVVGVAPPTFNFPDEAQLWRPIALEPRALECRACRFFNGPIALLEPGVTFARARSETRVFAARLHARFPDSETGLDYDIQPLHDHIVGNTRTPFLVLLGAVACLLLIACANVATLLLVRTSSREAELAVRVAIGAGRGRIVSQLLVESLVLAAAGGALGIALAELGARAIVAAQPPGIPALADISIDPRVALVALATMMTAGIAFGIAPAIHAGRTDAALALRSGGRGASGRRGAARSHGVFLATEVALVVPLLVGASLLVQSFTKLISQDVGFSPAGVVRFDLALPVCGTAWARDTTCAGVRDPRYNTQDKTTRFERELLESLRSMPGTTNASIVFGAPFTNYAKNQTWIVVDGLPPAPPDKPNVAEAKYVSPGYFATLRIPLLAGRDFTDADRFEGRQVAIVSEGAVKAYFGDENPIGKTIRDEGTVIGIVGDTKTEALSDDPTPAIYRPFSQIGLGMGTVLIRSTADPGTVITAARARLAAIDRALPIEHATAFEADVRGSASSVRLAASVLAAFAVAALLLAMLGVYGLVAYTVRTRQRELGIRLALGAPSGGLVALVVRGGLVFVGIGVAAGTAVSLMGSRALRGVVFGIQANDLATYALAIVALLAIAGLALWIPARRATRIDPLIAMRPE